MAVKGMYWREAATLMLAAPEYPSTKSKKSSKNSSPEDYNILMLKRSSKSNFQPNALVFPGGAIDNEDVQDDWKGLFEEVTGKPFREVVARLEISGPRLPQFTLNWLKRESTMPGEVGFRITAIRETFEESGVLLVLSAEDFKKKDLSSLDRSRPTVLSRIGSVRQWRQRMRKDTGQFLAMCLELKVVPNIWALTEWCNWLTPPMRKVAEPPAKPYRFDTVFFLCCLSETPRSSADEQETTQSQWVSPRETLDYYCQEKSLDLHPPQQMELSRMCKLPRLADLCAFANAREKSGLRRTFPVFTICSDGALLLYPGDGMYPKHPLLNGSESPPISDKSVQETGAGHKDLHRIERTASQQRLISNVSADGHLIPLCTHEVAPPGAQL